MSAPHGVEALVASPRSGGTGLSYHPALLPSLSLPSPVPPRPVTVLDPTASFPKPRGRSGSPRRVDGIHLPQTLRLPVSPALWRKVLQRKAGFGAVVIPGERDGGDVHVAGNRGRDPTSCAALTFKCWPHVVLLRPPESRVLRELPSAAPHSRCKRRAWVPSEKNPPSTCGPRGHWATESWSLTDACG